MIKLDVGDIGFWSSFSIVLGLISLVLSYWLGKMFGMQWVMVATALMDIPITFFLFKRSMVGLKLSIMRVWRDALVLAAWVCLPLCVFVFYLKATSPMGLLLSLISCSITFSALWAACLLLMGLSRLEHQLLRSKCQAYLS